MRERELEQPTAALPGVDSRRHRDGMRVVIDLDIVLVTDVKPFEIFREPTTRSMLSKRPPGMSVRAGRKFA